MPLGRLGSRGLELRLPVLRALDERAAPELLTVECHGLIDEVVDDLGRRVDVDRHRSVEGDDGGAQGVPGSDEIDPRVRHVHLGSRDVGLGPRADIEKSFGGAQVELAALERLLLHADEALTEQRVRVCLLDRQRDELPLELDVLDRDLGELPRCLGRREVLAEVEQELGELDLSDEGVVQISVDEHGHGRARRRGREAGPLAPLG